MVGICEQTATMASAILSMSGSTACLTPRVSSFMLEAESAYMLRPETTHEALSAGERERMLFLIFSAVVNLIFWRKTSVT